MSYDIKWLTDKFESGETIKYIFFWGHTDNENDDVGKFVFSQWFYSPFVVDDIEYQTAEHWMMAHKAKLFGDDKAFAEILKANKPREVKDIGRQIRGFDEVRWNDKKFEIVKTGNIHKFHQNKKLKDFFISTADRVIAEASPTDTIWGIGLTKDSNMVDNPYTWRGANLLGFALMETRDFLKQFGDFQYLNATLAPPWKMYPTVGPLDMFWRMGQGEQYIIDFGKYFNGLSNRDRIIYKLSYPATGDWSEFYK